MKWSKSKQFKRTGPKPCLAVGDEVEFVVGEEKCLGEVTEGGGEYYIRTFGKWNNVVFELLSIEKPFVYVEAIQGYADGGLWPYSKTLKDLTKVVKSVLKDCEKHNAKLEQEKAKVAEPRKGSLENPWSVADYKNLLTDLPVGDHYKFESGEILQRVE